MNLETPDGEDVEALKIFMEQIHERNKMAKVKGREFILFVMMKNEEK